MYPWWMYVRVCLLWGNPGRGGKLGQGNGNTTKASMATFDHRCPPSMTLLSMLLASTYYMEQAGFSVAIVAHCPSCLLSAHLPFSLL